MHARVAGASRCMRSRAADGDKQQQAYVVGGVNSSSSMRIRHASAGVRMRLASGCLGASNSVLLNTLIEEMSSQRKLLQREAEARATFAGVRALPNTLNL
jgi:hypothetical protein